MSAKDVPRRLELLQMAKEQTRRNSSSQKIFAIALQRIQRQRLLDYIPVTFVAIEYSHTTKTYKNRVDEIA